MPPGDIDNIWKDHCDIIKGTSVENILQSENNRGRPRKSAKQSNSENVSSVTKEIHTSLLKRKGKGKFERSIIKKNKDIKKKKLENKIKDRIHTYKVKGSLDSGAQKVKQNIEEYKTPIKGLDSPMRINTSSTMKDIGASTFQKEALKKANRTNNEINIQLNEAPAVKIKRTFNIERPIRHLSFDNSNKEVQRKNSPLNDLKLKSNPITLSPNTLMQNGLPDTTAEKNQLETNECLPITEPLEEDLKEIISKLPDNPLNPIEGHIHNHVHGEMCGHIMINHNNHIDLIHDGELHWTDPKGIIYSHKLGITDVNPTGCRPITNLGNEKNIISNVYISEGLITPHVRIIFHNRQIWLNLLLVRLTNSSGRNS